MPLPDLDLDLAPEERDAILDRIAREVVRRRLESPVVLCLEVHRPLQFVLSQGLIVFTPILSMLFGAVPLEKLTLLMQDRQNLDRLIGRIEARAQERGGEGSGVLSSEFRVPSRAGHTPEP